MGGVSLDGLNFSIYVNWPGAIHEGNGEALLQDWREGVPGAFTMGFRNGIFCIGCCWALMVLLFAAGVMNLVWVAAIAAFVLAEKLAPQGRWLSRLAGVLLFAWGTYVVVSLP